MNQDIWVEKFSREALPIILRRFHPQRVLLFGSRATGLAREDSDLDVIIVSNDFIGIKFVNRTTMLYKAVKFPKHVDYLCYPPDEFERLQKTSSSVREAVQSAQVLSIQSV